MKTLLLFLSASAMFGGLASGAEVQAISSEKREKMAAVHDKMAACLRANQPMMECREEMMKSCRAVMGKAACPMMDGKFVPGMRDQMMNHDEASR